MLTPISLLWLPSFVATLVVFLGGFIMNMLMPHHRTDWSKVPDEDALSDAIRSQGLERGQYAIPYASGPKDVAEQAHQERVAQGPNALLVIGPNEVGPSLRQLFLHYVHIAVVSIFVAYVCSAAIPTGADYMKVFQVAGTAAFLAYGGAVFTLSIWYHFAWSYTWKRVVDGFIYSLLTAGAFGWLWPTIG